MFFCVKERPWNLRIHKRRVHNSENEEISPDFLSPPPLPPNETDAMPPSSVSSRAAKNKRKRRKKKRKRQKRESSGSEDIPILGITESAKDKKRRKPNELYRVIDMAPPSVSHTPPPQMSKEEDVAATDPPSSIMAPVFAIAPPPIPPIKAKEVIIIKDEDPPPIIQNRDKPSPSPPTTVVSVLNLLGMHDWVARFEKEEVQMPELRGLDEDALQKQFNRCVTLLPAFFYDYDNCNLCKIEMPWGMRRRLAAWIAAHDEMLEALTDNWAYF